MLTNSTMKKNFSASHTACSAGSSRPQLSRRRQISSAAQSSPWSGISWMKRQSIGVLIWA